MLAIGMPMSAMAPSPLMAPPSSNPPSSSSMRSPSSSLQTQQLSLGLLSLHPSISALETTTNRPALPDHHDIGPEPIAAVQPPEEPTVAMAPVYHIPDDGARVEAYVRSLEALSGSLTKHNAVVIELGSEESALMRCALESARLYFRIRAQSSSGGS
ncbi:hypothetical protein NE237_007654 [Protea cynaroides]|uniref:Uncharacterized protein n=1 Tax=Protea cynaroides TaxID=273540 RepID=A0A9Q0KPW9_9MAGN|nr:hypothetical protein NE237_007654 [Protea cynaroides]